LRRLNKKYPINPVRNSSRALNPAGIILKSNPVSEQRSIISNGVKIGQRGFTPHLIKGAGFTLIEIVIVLAVIAVLVAIITPLIGGYLEDTKITRAQSDCKVLAQSILNFNEDTAVFPIYSFSSGSTDPLKNDNAIIDVLYTKGNKARTSGTETEDWLTGNRDHLRNHLEKGVTPLGGSYPTTPRTFAWRGPYQTNFMPDPWNNKYYVNATHLKPGSANNAVWVLSAGPNGVIETSFTQSATGATTPTLGGDDIGYRIK